jgi:hypothetical protein
MEVITIMKLNNTKRWNRGADDHLVISWSVSLTIEYLTNCLRGKIYVGGVAV